jgi:hypothetical protein
MVTGTSAIGISTTGWEIHLVHLDGTAYYQHIAPSGDTISSLDCYAVPVKEKTWVFPEPSAPEKKRVPAKKNLMAWGGNFGKKRDSRENTHH